jgi:hypothetical protein
MRRLIPIVSILIASSVVAVVLTAQGQGRSSEVVTCSSTADLPAGRSLTGTWTGIDKRTYIIRQIGTCVWFGGQSPYAKQVENVFFGAVSSTGSTVLGVWANVQKAAGPETSGRLVFSVKTSQSGTLYLLRRGSGAGFPARYLKRPPP